MGYGRRSQLECWHHAIWSLLGWLPQLVHRFRLFARHRLGAPGVRLLHVLALQEENRALLCSRHQGAEHLQLLVPHSIPRRLPSSQHQTRNGDRFDLAGSTNSGSSNLFFAELSGRVVAFDTLAIYQLNSRTLRACSRFFALSIRALLCTSCT